VLGAHGGRFPRIGRFLGITRGPAGDGGGAGPLRQSWSGRMPQAVAAGVALVGAGAALLVTGLTGSSLRSGDEAARALPTVTPVGVPADELAKLPRATTFTSIPAAPLDPDPFAVTGGLVVHPLTPQVLYAGPGKRPIAVLPATQLGARPGFPW
jgi:hypothetical protein